MSAPSSRRRYLSVWLRRLATDRIARTRSAAPPEQPPLVVALGVKNALQLAAMNDAAARLGLRAGMALADAKAMYPMLTVADADPDADRGLLEAIADWCDRYTPLIGLDPPDGLMLDITGCAHLFGGEAAFCGDIVQRLGLQGFAARAAIADTVGCAWAVARFSPPPCGEGSGVGVARYGTSVPRGTTPHPNPPPQGGRESAPHPILFAIVPPSGVREALLPLRLAALRIAPDIEAALGQAGFKCIAEVIDRPRAPLAARFGEEFIRRIDQAVGRDDEPITPRLPVPPYVAERRFADPILLESDVLRTTELLAQELARMLERRGEGARRLQVALFRTDGKVYRTEVGTGAPLRDPARMRALFAERLAAVGEVCDPGFGFDVVRLVALATERCDPVQTGLTAPDHTAELAHLVDRLGARFGLRRVTRPVPQDSHIPEFAVAAVAAHVNLSDLILKSRAQHGVSKDGCIAREEHQGVYARLRGLSRHALKAQIRGHPSRRAQERALQDEAANFFLAGTEDENRFHQDGLCPPRPIRLFGRPEPIEAIAEVPDGPPVRFRWRRVLHQVAHAEGPERIAMEWWRDHKGRALTRDYFRVESREGVRVWVYREGLYGRELMEPRWFLHGLFA
jgi:protein ImuB